MKSALTNGFAVDETSRVKSRMKASCLGSAIVLAFSFGFSTAVGAEPIVPTTRAAASGPAADDARRANDLAQADYYQKQAKAIDGQHAPWWGQPLQLLLSAALGLGGSIATFLISNRASDRKLQESELRRYQRQQLQVGLAVRALLEALTRLDLSGVIPPADFLSRALLVDQPPQPADFARANPYYRKYDLVSTVYRLCAFLGWIELYRTDPEFLSGPPDERARFEACVNRIRSCLSDDDIAKVAEWAGQLPPKSPSASVRDGVILADDQRAIGEKMLSAIEKDAPRSVVGYAFFAESLFRYPGEFDPQQDAKEGKHPDLPQDHWIWNATSFIVGMGDPPSGTTDPSSIQDCRILRLRAVRETLFTLLALLLPIELQNGMGESRAD